MKTKLTALLLTAIMILSCLAGCGKQENNKQNEKENQNGDTWVDTESAVGGRTHQKAESLPASCTLVGTDFLPPIGNQGSIGSCSSSSIAYCQFTNAVARYLHSINPDSVFKPASGDSRYLISSKYAMNFAGAGTAWVYDVLKDHGALVRADSDFWRNASGGASGGVKNDPYLESSSWDVEMGEMAKALNMRLLNYEQVWMNGYNFQLTTTDSGKDLVEKIKDAVATGNVVVTGGLSNYWRYEQIDGLGDLGQKGDHALVYACQSGEPGGHQVSIVGYDDNITVHMAGTEVKGAFLVANSWGDWKNDGYVWLMYDAVNKVSEYEALRSDKANTNHRYLSLGEENAWFGTTLHLKDVNTDLDFVKKGSTTIEGKTYPTYYIKGATGYLSYNGKNVAGISNTPTDQNALWAVIPVSDLSRLPYYDATIGARDQAQYQGAYLLYAVNNSGNKLLYGGAAYYGSCDDAYLYSLSEMYYSYYNLCLKLDGYDAAKDTQTITVYGNNGAGYEITRTYAMDQFCFVYWDCDIVCDDPGYTVEIEVEAKNREQFYVELLQTDATGKTTTHLPAMFQYGQNFSNVHPNNEYCSADHYLNFKGEVDGGLCTGYITLGYSAIMGANTNYKDYLWGVNIVTTSSDVSIQSITLKDQTGNVLCKITPPDPKNADGRYFFDYGNELKADGKSGIYKLQNVNGGQFITKDKVLLSVGDEEDAAIFDFLYNSSTNQYQLQLYGKSYILDIQGKEIKEGVGLRVLNGFGNRQTQTWRVIRNEDGTVNIRLACDTKFAIGIKDGVLCLVTGGDIKTYGTWMLYAGGEVESTFTLDYACDTISFTCHKGKASGKLSCVITDASGKEICQKELSFNQNGIASFTEKLQKGSYLITLYSGNAPAKNADNLIFTIN